MISELATCVVQQRVLSFNQQPIQRISGEIKTDSWIFLGLSTVRRHKLDHLDINSTTAVAGNAGLTLTSAATAVVEYMAKWSNLCLRTVLYETCICWEQTFDGWKMPITVMQLKIQTINFTCTQYPFQEMGKTCKSCTVKIWWKSLLFFKLLKLTVTW